MHRNAEGAQAAEEPQEPQVTNADAGMQAVMEDVDESDDEMVDEALEAHMGPGLWTKARIRGGLRILLAAFRLPIVKLSESS